MNFINPTSGNSLVTAAHKQDRINNTQTRTEKQNGTKNVIKTEKSKNQITPKQLKPSGGILHCVTIIIII